VNGHRKNTAWRHTRSQYPFIGCALTGLGHYPFIGTAAKEARRSRMLASLALALILAPPSIT
jgi:hypothetical protein